jgi:transposase
VSQGANNMYVRQKKNMSGTVSVQIIDKSTGKYEVLKTIGCSSEESEIEELVEKGKEWIKNKLSQFTIDFQDERKQAETYLDQISQINICGTHLLLDKIYETIGFNQIGGPLLKQLVYSRICFPVSKLKTTEYLRKYYSTELNVDKIYRYLDKLTNKKQDQLQKISYQHTLQILGNNISIVFYDVTTLYFSADTEDDLRKTGFSKEGKHQNPQIVLGLLVSIDGYPLAYEIFEGNKFEGHTMLPVIETFKHKYNLEKLVIIADSGLLSNANIQQLQSKGYEYILGGRIKNETGSLKEKIHQLKLGNGESAVIKKDKHTRIIISYSAARSKKDKFNRKKGLARLEKQIKSGKLTKSTINKRGYNKYLKLEGETRISINQEAYQADCKWDGLKGYITNTKLTKEEIIENYGHLWKIERAFRISKADLKIRPIFHRLEHRIKAHICISFLAYKVYKELERQLKSKESHLSPEKAIEVAKTIYSIRLTTPMNKEIVEKKIITNDDQVYLCNLFKI